MTTEQKTVPTSFHNVQVVTTPHIDPNTGKIVHLTLFNPAALIVKSRDSVINYQLVSPTPEGTRFTGLTASPSPNEQLSEAIVSLSGKLITISDANTAEETLSITLHFVDKDGNPFDVDPDVDNIPDPV